jgi:hypothetical protein
MHLTLLFFLNAPQALSWLAVRPRCCACEGLPLTSCSVGATRAPHAMLCGACWRPCAAGRSALIAPGLLFAVSPLCCFSRSTTASCCRMMLQLAVYNVSIRNSAPHAAWDGLRRPSHPDATGVRAAWGRQCGPDDVRLPATRQGGADQGSGALMTSKTPPCQAAPAQSNGSKAFRHGSRSINRLTARTGSNAKWHWAAPACTVLFSGASPYAMQAAPVITRQATEHCYGGQHVSDYPKHWKSLDVTPSCQLAAPCAVTHWLDTPPSTRSVAGDAALQQHLATY